MPTQTQATKAVTTLPALGSIGSAKHRAAITRMIEQGGRYYPADTPQTLYKPGTKIPRSPAPASYEDYQGAGEPLPTQSDLGSTLSLLREMFRTGYTSEDVKAWFDTNRYLPSALYYHWRLSTDKRVYSFHDWAWSEVTKTETRKRYKGRGVEAATVPAAHAPIPPNYSIPFSPPSTEQASPPLGSDPYPVRPDEFKAYIRYVRTHPGLSYTALRQAVIPGVTAYRRGKVMRASTEQGLVHWVKGKGKTRHYYVPGAEPDSRPAETPVRKSRKSPVVKSASKRPHKPRTPAWQRLRDWDAQRLQEFQRASQERTAPPIPEGMTDLAEILAWCDEHPADRRPEIGSLATVSALISDTQLNEMIALERVRVTGWQHVIRSGMPTMAGTTPSHTARNRSTRTETRYSPCAILACPIGTSPLSLPSPCRLSPIGSSALRTWMSACASSIPSTMSLRPLPLIFGSSLDRLRRSIRSRPVVRKSNPKSHYRHPRLAEDRGQADRGLIFSACNALVSSDLLVADPALVTCSRCQRALAQIARSQQSPEEQARRVLATVRQYSATSEEDHLTVSRSLDCSPDSVAPLVRRAADLLRDDSPDLWPWMELPAGVGVF